MVGRCQSVIAELNVGRIATELLNYGKGIAIRYRLFYSSALVSPRIWTDNRSLVPDFYTCNIR